MLSDTPAHSRASRRSRSVVRPLVALLVALTTIVAGFGIPANAADEPQDGTLTVDSTTIELGQPIQIDFTVDEPTDRNWVAIYAANATPGVQDSLHWQYVPEASGSLTWDGGETGEWRVQHPIGAGEYLVYLLHNDGYTQLAEPVRLTITAPAEEEIPVPAPLEPTGETSDLTVLTWNIYHGGLDDDRTNTENRQQIAELIADTNPDVFFAIETYGAADIILAELNGLDENRTYTGTRITSQANDNLWIFTHLPIVETFPAPTGLSVNDFNIGGVRVRLDNNREVSLFDVWSTYTNPWIGYLIDENAEDVAAGREPRHSADEVIAADRVQATSIADFLTYIDEHTAGHDDLAIVTGDLNTVAASDWTEEAATCPSHYGLHYDLPATVQFTDAGFADVYRVANPDICESPGITWGPREDLLTPQRIDLMFGRGTQLGVVESSALDQRLPEHGQGQFYSDHSAILAQLQVGSSVEGEPVPVDPEPSTPPTDEGDDNGTDDGNAGDGNTDEDENLDRDREPTKPSGLPNTGQ